MDFTHKFFKKIMWRSSKVHVSDELMLPPQEELLTRLTFSPIEAHFYQRQHESCAKFAHEVIGSIKDDFNKRNVLSGICDFLSNFVVSSNSFILQFQGSYCDYIISRNLHVTSRNYKGFFVILSKLNIEAPESCLPQGIRNSPLSLYFLFLSLFFSILPTFTYKTLDLYLSRSSTWYQSKVLSSKLTLEKLQVQIQLLKDFPRIFNPIEPCKVVQIKLCDLMELYE